MILLTCSSQNHGKENDDRQGLGENGELLFNRDRALDLQDEKN